MTLFIKHIKRHLLATALVVTATGVSAATAPTLKVSLDSAYVLMGNLVGVNAQVIVDSDAEGTLSFDTEDVNHLGIELHHTGDARRTDLGNNRTQIDQTYYVQAFDSGAYALPPVRYIVGTDTVASDSLSLKVVPVDVSQLEDINPDADVLDAGRKWYDFMPDFILDYWIWWLVALLIIAAGICAALILTRKVEVKIMRKPPVPADVVALRKLEKLRESKLWESGQEKEYYTKLVDILREYLHRQFGINAMEMTSTQIMNAVTNNSHAYISKENMRQIIKVADYVKFAQARPLPDDNVSALRSAVKFVEDTRPRHQEASTDQNKQPQNSQQ